MNNSVSKIISPNTPKLESSRKKIFSYGRERPLEFPQATLVGHEQVVQRSQHKHAGGNEIPGGATRGGD